MPEELRLLACSVCKTIEELPDYQGRPEGDHLLKRLLENHGPENDRHIGQLFRMPKDTWNKLSNDGKREIAQKIGSQLTNGGETGLGAEFYDVKNTFVDDAHKCFNRHNRNPDCNDYKTDSKRLTPNTQAERKEAGLPAYSHADDRYLCEYCPVHSLVMTAKRKRAGLYDG